MGDRLQRPGRSDYDFVDGGTPEPPKPIDTQLTPNALLVEAGRQLGVLSLLSGNIHPVLQQMAEQHAAYQAQRGVQGHQRWEQRVQQLAAAMPECEEFRECAAESWDWNTMQQAAPEMFTSWRQSPGHWSAINGRCSFWGYAMALNEKQNIWYACAIFADLREKR